MSQNVAYAINEYIKTNIPTVGNFYPGRFAPQTEAGDNFVTYFLLPGQVYDLFGLKRDIVEYTFYNNNFDQLQSDIRSIMDLLNVQDIQNEALAEAGYIIQDTHFAPVGRGQSHFADGEEHYTMSAELTIMFTVNDSPIINMQHGADALLTV